jgi:DNA-binding SARP family transcriptional activator
METPDPLQLQNELLRALCTALQVPKGYLALAIEGLPPGLLRVHVVYGDLEIEAGDTIRRPFFSRLEPQLVSALLPASHPPEQDWREINLFCPLSVETGLDGVLALGEKQKGEPFTPEEINLCAELIQQLDQVGRLVRLRERHNHYLEAARLQGQTLQQLEKEVTFSSPPALQVGERQGVSLEIRVLGPLQVARHGELLPESAWGSEKAKALLAYLLWKSPLGVGREELSQRLWPDRSVDEAANVFHVTLHRLRRALQLEGEGDKAEGYIQHERGWYRFNIQAPHWLDVKAFQELAARSEAASLKAAVELYRGAYFEDMTWAFPPEIEAERRRLEQLHGDTLRRLASQTNSREASLYLEKLLAIEPGDETVHQALVLNYLARGRSDLARHQITRWQQALADLDLEPLPEALELWQRVEVTGKGETN